jgi:hypothetical protein
VSQLRPRIQPLVWGHLTFSNYEEEEKDVKNIESPTQMVLFTLLLKENIFLQETNAWIHFASRKASSKKSVFPVD